MTSAPAIPTCYLESFPLSEIKIDRSFVHDVASSVAKRVIVEGVVKLGAALGIRVVAEGIETDEERAIMRSLGCSIGQGYLFARPMEWARLGPLFDGGQGFADRILDDAAASP